MKYKKCDNRPPVSSINQLMAVKIIGKCFESLVEFHQDFETLTHKNSGHFSSHEVESVQWATKAFMPGAFVAIKNVLLF